MIPQPVHTIGGPNVGTGTAAGKRFLDIVGVFGAEASRRSLIFKTNAPRWNVEGQEVPRRG